MRALLRLGCFAIAVLLTWNAAQVQAGPLPLDPNAMVGYKGSSTLSNVQAPFSISSTIEYAVYAPGQFNLTFGAGADPSNGTQFVYAYQGYNTGVATAGRTIASFSVNVLPGGGATNIESLPAPPFTSYGQQPVSSSFGGSPPSSARWSYTTAVLPLGQQTQILLFTSPKGPTRSSASITGGGLGATTVPAQYVPTPVPEPATWALLAFGGAALVAARRRMR